MSNKGRTPFEIIDKLILNNQDISEGVIEDYQSKVTIEQHELIEFVESYCEIDDTMSEEEIVKAVKERYGK